MTNDPQVLVALIAALGGILTTWLTVKYRDAKVKAKQPKDRMENIFDGYEGLIKQKDLDISRQGTVIGSLENLVKTLENDLLATKALLESCKKELTISQQQNSELRTQLDSMKREYRKKGSDQKHV